MSFLRIVWLLQQLCGWLVSPELGGGNAGSGGPGPGRGTRGLLGFKTDYMYCQNPPVKNGLWEKTLGFQHS